MTLAADKQAKAFADGGDRDEPDFGLSALGIEWEQMDEREILDFYTRSPELLEKRRTSRQLPRGTRISVRAPRRSL